MPSSKRVRIEEEGQNDLISQLPDSILVEILSHLPTLDAVKMASFSRFRNLWTGIRCLSFDQCAFHEHDDDSHTNDNDVDDSPTPNYDERFLYLIRRVLILHERPTIDEFHLKFGFNLFYATSHYDYDHSSKVKRMASELLVWIQFALRKQVKVLDIDLIGCVFYWPDPEVHYELPSSILTNKYLMELSLCGCGIKGKGNIQLMSLTKLSLKGIKLSDEIMSEILQGCPMLEEVTLKECCGLSKLNMTNHNIKSLRIFLGSPNLPELEISCPNIKSFKLGGSIKLVHFKVPCKVSRVSLNFSHDFKGESIAYGTIMMLLRTLANANTFILYTSTTLIFTQWALSRRAQIQYHWKSIEFRLIFSKWHLPGIWSILKSSISLETLTFYIGPGWKYTSTTTEAKSNEVYNFVGKNYLKSQNGDFPWLKTVNIYGYVTDSYVFELIEFLLKNAPLLERMVISTKKTINCVHKVEFFDHSVENLENCFTSSKLLEFSQKLLSLPRASKSAIIQLCY